MREDKTYTSSSLLLPVCDEMKLEKTIINNERMVWNFQRSKSPVVCDMTPTISTIPRLRNANTDGPRF